uniref:Uncharacterized protein n=1 Tax=viral metagenome TaxID=1070528 RepID=A0A6C0EGA6_9ZZZZ
MNFDLNINNYNKKELEDLFELPPVYNKDLLDEKEFTMKKNMIMNISIPEDKKAQIFSFIENAKNVILSSIHNTFKHDIEVLEDVYNAEFKLKPVNVFESGGYHVVQEQNTHHYANAYVNNFVKGTINPIKQTTIRNTLNIDTRFRDNYYGSSSTNFQLDLPIKLSSILTMEMTAFEIPNSFMNISKQMGNNFFTIIVHVGEILEVGTVVIPTGNYVFADLIQYINNYISVVFKDKKYLKYIYFTNNISTISTSESLVLGFSGSGQTIVGINSSYLNDNKGLNKDDELFNFSLRFDFDVDENPDDTPLPLKLGWMLGFRNGAYENNSAYVSEGLINLAGPKYVFLVVDDYNNNVNNGFYSAFTNSMLNKNILARISLQPGSFNTTSSQNNLSVISYPRQYFGPVDIQKINVQLLDEYGRVLNLNNMDFSFCLSFQTVYDI